MFKQACFVRDSLLICLFFWLKLSRSGQGKGEGMVNYNTSNILFFFKEKKGNYSKFIIL
jgi:hypothetical protein